jgi:hypothetical protein
VHHEAQGGVQQGTGLFRVETGDQLGRALDVGKEHRDLLALALQDVPVGEDLLDEIQWGIGAGCRVLGTDGCDGGWGGGNRTTRPDEHPTVLLDSELLYLDEFLLERRELVVVKVKLYLEGAIGSATTVLQEDDDLVEHSIKVHGTASMDMTSGREKIYGTVVLGT